MQLILCFVENRWTVIMLRRRGTYTVNADPDNRYNRPKSTESASFTVKKSGMLYCLLQFPLYITFYIYVCLKLKNSRDTCY